MNQKKNNKQAPKSKKNVKKKQKKFNKLKVIIPIIILLCAGIIYFFLSPIFNITEIKVSGNEKISAEEIINLSKLQIQQNIFKKTRYKITENIEKNRYIKEVKINRKLPGIIYIQIKERDVEYQIEYNENFVYIDSQGYILEISQEKKEVIIIKGIENQGYENIKRLNNNELDKLEVIIKIKEAMNQINKKDEITYIDVSDSENYVVYLEKEKKTIYFGDGSNLKEKVLNIEKILEAEKETQGIIYINGNLNAGFKPYFAEN